MNSSFLVLLVTLLLFVVSVIDLRAGRWMFRKSLSMERHPALFPGIVAFQIVLAVYGFAYFALKNIQTRDHKPLVPAFLLDFASHLIGVSPEVVLVLVFGVIPAVLWVLLGLLARHVGVRCSDSK